MKKVTTIIAVALMTLSISAPTMADPWYWVIDVNGADIRSRAHNEGKVKCTVPLHGTIHRYREQNWSRWIYVKWTGAGVEWNYKDAKTGKYCPQWNRHGWIDKTKLYADR